MTTNINFFMFIYEPQFIADSVDSVVDFPCDEPFLQNKLKVSQLKP
ncbi:MAG: hypothetical protein ABIH80_04820 [Methanobacteriota archaeon]